MRAGVVLVVIAILATSLRAQTRTADGVAAFAREDYQLAADILKPLAERLVAPDQTAAFFMAMLYETGRGVPRDELRACALYLRSDPQSPLGRQAYRLVINLSRFHDPEWTQDCHFLARAGFTHRFEPVTFNLEPGNWIAWDLQGATITYQGRSKRFEDELAGGGNVLLPVRYTELQVGLLRLSGRHFFEITSWSPDTQKQLWNLNWHLYEAVRDDLVSIAGETALTISAPEPPIDSSFDIRSVVDLRVNNNGDAEWALLTGKRARTEVIQPDAERREELARAEARKAAEARVNWALVREVSRAPSMVYSEADGCDSIFVYGWSADHTEAIAIRADRELLQLSTTTATLSLASQRDGLQVSIHVYERPVRSWPFCTDTPMPLPEEKWRAVGGTLTIELSPPENRVRTPYLNRATLRIVNAEFVNDSGVRVRQTAPITLTAMVGGGTGA